MHNITDEQLMAFADRELPKAEHDQLAKLIAAVPELRARVQMFEATGATLSQAFDEVLTEPVPAEWVYLVNGMRPSESRARKPVQRDEVSFGVLDTMRRFFFGQFGGALAGLAGIAVIAGSGGWLLHAGLATGVQQSAVAQLVRTDANLLVADGILATALESRSSRDVVNGPSASKLTLMSTFRNRSGDVCREYGVSGADQFAGVACRQDNGIWRVDLHTQVASVIKSASTAPASGGGTEVYEAALDAMRDGDVFDAATEAQEISRWHK